MKIYCKDLKGHVTKIINYEKTEMIPLTIVESKSQSKILLYMPKKNLILMMIIKSIIKSEIIIIILENIEVLLIILAI